MYSYHNELWFAVGFVANDAEGVKFFLFFVILDSHNFCFGGRPTPTVFVASLILLRADFRFSVLLAPAPTFGQPSLRVVFFFALSLSSLMSNSIVAQGTSWNVLSGTHD